MNYFYLLFLGNLIFFQYFLPLLGKEKNFIFPHPKLFSMIRRKVFKFCTSTNRDWFFVVDNKGFLYWEESEPKIYANSIKDRRFLNNFYRNLRKNNQNRYLPEYKCKKKKLSST